MKILFAFFTMVSVPFHDNAIIVELFIDNLYAIILTERLSTMVTHNIYLSTIFVINPAAFPALPGHGINSLWLDNLISNTTGF
ncbi:MAG: hypothetical protein AB1489_05400 [Acidobacteriota bacterium]